MEALLGKTVLLVTHQVDFLPAFESVLVSTNYKAPFEILTFVFLLIPLCINEELMVLITRSKFSSVTLLLVNTPK